MTISSSVVRNMSHFIAEALGAAGRRAGTLELNDSCVLHTPGFFIHTLAGSIPHLTSEVYELAFSEASRPLQISIDTTYTFHENVKPSGKSISQFVGLSKCPNFLSIHNPLRELVQGFNDKSGVSIWTRRGRHTLSNSKFIQIVNDFEPTLFQTLSDYDVTESSSIKRIRKSISRNIEYLDEVILKTNTSKERAFATIELGWFLASPTYADSALTDILQKQTDFLGFVINGVSSANGRKEAVLSIAEKLPPNKPRFASGMFDLPEIMEMVKVGIDLFDSSVVTRRTDEGLAFSLELEELTYPDKVRIHQPINESLPGISQENDERKPRMDDSIKLKDDDVPLLLNLKDKRYFDDFSPISKTCDCYTCRKYTRSYIHHLLSTSELLGPVLLMMHNLIQFDQFFKVIRYTLPDDKKFTELHQHLKTRSKIPIINSLPQSTNTRDANDEEVT